MLLSLFVGAYFVGLSYSTGVLVWRFLARKNEGACVSAPMAVIVGYGALCVLCGWISIFRPLDLTTHLPVVGLVAGLSLYLKPDFISPAKLFFKRLKQSAFWEIAPFGLLAALIFYKTPQSCPYPTCVYDAGLYYAQTIQWTTEYAVVPGLGNLHDRLAFNSFWLMGASYFSLPFLGYGNLHLINGWFAIAVLAYAVNEFADKSRGIKRYFALTAFLGVLFFFYPYLSEAQADLGVALLTIVLIDQFISAPSGLFSGKMRLLLGALLLVIKLSAFPVLILLLPDLFRQIKARKFDFIAGVALIIAPFLIRNYYLSGYLIFPIETIDLFSPDWKMPAEAVEYQRNVIQALAYSPAAQYDPQFLSQSFWEKNAVWIESLWLSQKIALIGVLVGAGVWFWRKSPPAPPLSGGETFAPLALTGNVSPPDKGGPGGDFYTFSILILALTLWRLTAPDFRFGAGIILSLLALNFVHLLNVFSYKWLKPTFFGGIMAFSLVVQLYSATKIPFNPLTPPPNEKIQRGEQCFDAPLPCSPNRPANVRLRTKGLADGFYVEKGN